MISRRQIIWRSARPIFAIFTLNESFLGVDDRSGPLFSICQGTLPWQPILCKNGAKLPTRVHLLLCHSETEWAIVLRMSALIAALIVLDRVKNGENRFSSFWVNWGRKWKLCFDSAKIGLYRGISQQLLNRCLRTFQHWQMYICGL